MLGNERKGDDNFETTRDGLVVTGNFANNKRKTTNRSLRDLKSFFITNFRSELVLSFPSIVIFSGKHHLLVLSFHHYFYLLKRKLFQLLQTNNGRRRSFEKMKILCSERRKESTGRFKLKNNSGNDLFSSRVFETAACKMLV